MRAIFEKELEELHLDMIKMASLVEESIENTIIALKDQSTELAKRVYRQDDAIDNLEHRIEKRCLKLIATQQPLAKDLRTISSALKIITDLERIGDHSADIAEITLRLVNQKYIKPLIDIPIMAEKAKKMVNMSIDSYIRKDIELAKEICLKDEEVDEMFNTIIFELINIMKNSPEKVEQTIDLMFVVKYLERMADHATNISEWVVFIVTGEHEHLQHSEKKDKG